MNAALDVARGLKTETRYCLPSDDPVHAEGNIGPAFRAGAAARRKPVEVLRCRGDESGSLWPAEQALERVYGTELSAIDGLLRTGARGRGSQSAVRRDETIPLENREQAPFSMQRDWGRDLYPAEDGPELRRIDTAFLERRPARPGSSTMRRRTRAWSWRSISHDGDVLLFPADAQVVLAVVAEPETGPSTENGDRPRPPEARDVL